VSVSIDEINSIMTSNSGMPLVGTSMVVKFSNENTYRGNVFLQLQAQGSDSVSYNKFKAQLGFKIGDAFINIGSVGEQEFSDAQEVALSYYKWGAGDYRTVMFDGTYWILSVTTEYLSALAEWCLEHGQTWIGGGTIVTGTIVADQIQSGSINTSRVSLTCLAPNDDGDIVNFGGVGYYEGSTGGYITKGIQMYGATDSRDADGKPNYSVSITNRGTRFNIEDGKVEGWGRKWQLNAKNGISLCNNSDYGTGHDYNYLNLGRTGSLINVNGDTRIDGSVLVRNSVLFESSGSLKMYGIPTSPDDLEFGTVYADSNGTLKIKLT
jgi:hypothetical protein